MMLLRLIRFSSIASTPARFISHIGVPRATRYIPSSTLIPPSTCAHRYLLPLQHQLPPVVGYSSAIHPEREHFRSLLKHFLERCNIEFEIYPLDYDFYEECIEDAKRRGYPVDGVNSVRTFLPLGVSYAKTGGAHLSHSPTLIWIALYTSCSFFVDEIFQRFPEEVPNIYRFNDRFIRGEPQGSAVLDAYVDIIRRASELYQPVASQLIATSTLNYIAANLLEHETKSMKILEVAEGYPDYQRNLSGLAVAYAFMAFPREIPLVDYIQAIPEMLSFINNVNDILSFYKEHAAGETTNHISNLSARTKKSRMEALHELMETTLDVRKKIVKILGESPDACEVFKRFMSGYFRFHFSSTWRYHMDDLGL